MARELPAMIRDCADAPRRPDRPHLIAEALRGRLREIYAPTPLVENDPFTHAMRERFVRIDRASEAQK